MRRLPRQGLARAHPWIPLRERDGDSAVAARSALRLAELSGWLCSGCWAAGVCRRGVCRRADLPYSPDGCPCGLTHRQVARRSSRRARGCSRGLPLSEGARRCPNRSPDLSVRRGCSRRAEYGSPMRGDFDVVRASGGVFAACMPRPRCSRRSPPARPPLARARRAARPPGYSLNGPSPPRSRRHA